MTETDSPDTLISEEQRANRAYLVGSFSLESRDSAQASLQEMERLCTAAGLTVAGAELVRVRTPNPAFYLGRGQVSRIIETAKELHAGIIVFDQPLSPVQMRNWARQAQLEVHDRHGVILEIFAQRATTREAQLQVEVARASYAQSHLVGMWQHLSRQGGGSRLARGEGEKQIEMDRRRLAERVTRAQRALELVSRQRLLRRSRRSDAFRVALLGYTNAGKSSLLNALANARVLSRNRLFATLDPTTRRLYLPPGNTILLTDTVGFVRNLPPQLVQAFHSTLEEATEAELILFVVDAADPEAARHLTITREILQELHATPPSRLIILNKIDLCPNPEEAELAIRGVLSDDERVIATSTMDGRGIGELREILAKEAAAALP